MIRAMAILAWAIALVLGCAPKAASAESLLERAASALERGEAALAEELYVQVIEDHPDSPQGHRGLARAKALQGQSQEAASILLFLGDGFAGLALYDEAIDALEEAVSLFPESLEIRASLGRAMMLQGKRLTEAEKHLAIACEAGRSELTTQLYLAAARWELGRFQEAELLYRNILAQSPGSALVQYQLARLLIATGKPVEARELLERAARRQKDDPALQTDLARSLANAGEIERSEEAYRRAIALDPTRKQAHYGLARLLRKKGDKAGSAAELEIYRQLTLEEHDRVREIELASLEVAKGWGLLREGNAMAAIELFGKLPESDETLLGLASAYIAIGDPPAAVEVLERAVTLNTERPELRLRLVEARLASARSTDG